VFAAETLLSDGPSAGPARPAVVVATAAAVETTATTTNPRVVRAFTFPSSDAPAGLVDAGATVRRARDRFPSVA